MLMLKRKPGECVESSGPCRVTVMGIEGRSIKLGFDAHKSVEFLRGELVRRPTNAPVDLPEHVAQQPTSLRTHLAVLSRTLHAIVRDYSGNAICLREMVDLKVKIDAYLGKHQT